MFLTGGCYSQVAPRAEALAAAVAVPLMLAAAAGACAERSGLLRGGWWLSGVRHAPHCADPAFAASATVSDEDLQAFGILLGGSGASRVRAAVRLAPTIPTQSTRICSLARSSLVSAATVVTAVLALVVGSEQVRRIGLAGLFWPYALAFHHILSGLAASLVCID